MLSRALLVLSLVTVGFSACTCQRPENVAAKERLSQPPPPDEVVKLAGEVIDVRKLHEDEEALVRVSRMGFAEVARRLHSLKYTSKARFAFTRDALNLDSEEEAEIVQTEEGDFSVSLKTRDGSHQELVYANDVLFLKNNNGRWRASRDPTGERQEMLEDSAGVWRMMFDLFRHTLQLEAPKEMTWDGRPALRYRFTVADKSGEAKELTQKLPSIDGRGILAADAGVPSEEDEAERQKDVMERVRLWRERARPQSGKGELVVDRETGVLLVVKFDGKLLVGDAKNPATLVANIDSRIEAIGKPAAVKVPAQAVDEVTRKKWPVRPREVLEKAGLVPPLPVGDAPGSGADAKREGRGQEPKAAEPPEGG